MAFFLTIHHQIRLIFHHDILSYHTSPNLIDFHNDILPYYTSLNLIDFHHDMLSYYTSINLINFHHDILIYYTSPNLIDFHHDICIIKVEQIINVDCMTRAEKFLVITPSCHASAVAKHVTSTGHDTYLLFTVCEIVKLRR